ncbi:hypothetical protein [Halorientalis sp.]|uniref:hypothetical protein n=1 Tax=Halorientalis sp. TaxID=1931229 RepID=UPI00263040C5|nr:hypothetical protein [Halorientalis sp.]
MTRHDAECGYCGGAGGLYTDRVETRFDALCLACAKELARQDDLEVGGRGVVA